MIRDSKTCSGVVSFFISLAFYLDFNWILNIFLVIRTFIRQNKNHNLD